MESPGAGISSDTQRNGHLNTLTIHRPRELAIGVACTKFKEAVPFELELTSDSDRSILEIVKPAQQRVDVWSIAVTSPKDPVALTAPSVIS